MKMTPNSPSRPWVTLRRMKDPSPLANNARTRQAIRFHWSLDPSVVFLNHGSFGACPIPVLQHQSALRARMERQPVQFFVRDLEGLLDEARAGLGNFIGAPARDLVWVPNATTAVNSVLRSLEFRAGDELLTTDHEYNACRNVLEFVAKRAGAKVVVAAVPFPLAHSGQVVEAIMDRVTDRTRIALLDHVTSQTGLVLPIRELVSALAVRGVETLVDGAHGPGMLDLNLEAIGAGWYTGNCHKWICAPKGAAFLYTRPDLQPRTRPAVISHGANSPRTDRSRYLIEFDWTGTDDPTPMLCVPEAIRFMGEIMPGGWTALRSNNHQLALRGRNVLCHVLGISPPCPDHMIGSLASLPLPDGGGAESKSPLYADPLQNELLEKFRIEVPVIPWPATPRRLIRVSGQVYNRDGDYEALGRALRALAF
jgi:isopenicillin-N epimerase